MRHMASLGHNELTHLTIYVTFAPSTGTNYCYDTLSLSQVTATYLKLGHP